MIVVAGKLSVPLVTAEEIAPVVVVGDVGGVLRATIFALFLISSTARTDMMVLKQFWFFTVCFRFFFQAP